MKHGFDPIDSNGYILAMTEESKLGEAVREAGAQTATPAQAKPAEVPSRAARVNEVIFLQTLGVRKINFLVVRDAAQALEWEPIVGF